MSDRDRQTADAALSETVRPFRRAALELSAPAAGLELALGALGALAAGLGPSLGRLDVSPFASVFLGEAGAAVAGVGEAPAAARARRQAAPKRPESDRGSGSPSALGGQGFGPGIARALKRFEREVAVTAAAESAVPGSGSAAAGIARGVAGLTSLPLVGELAQAALDAIPQPSPSDVGRPARRATPGFATGLFGPAPGAGSLLSAVSSAPAPSGEGLGRMFHAIQEFEKDVAVGKTAESLLPGSGPLAVPVARGARAAATLLEQLADTALDAVAPHGAPPRAAASARTPRSDATAAVRRELDAAAARSAPAAPVQPVRPAGGGSPAPDGARAAEPRDPSELAWLVNEALVEQARRHGVDLS